MREILFRAKRLDNGEWVEGSLIDSGNHGQVFIFPPLEGASIMPCRKNVYCEMVGVDSDTISQYTGLCDKNGKKIFENDIIHVCTNGFDREVFETKVLFGARSGVQGFYLENGRMMFYWGQTDLTKMDDAEVIGNSFDNQKE